MAEGGGENQPMETEDHQIIEPHCIEEDENLRDLKYLVKAAYLYEQQKWKYIILNQNYLRWQNAKFINQHTIVEDTILITRRFPHVFFLLLQYVYLNLPHFNFVGLNEEETDELLDDAYRYQVTRLLNEYGDYLLDNNSIQGMIYKGIIWKLEHYFVNNDDINFADCVRRLSELCENELLNVVNWRYITPRCLAEIMNHQDLNWNMEKKFIAAYKCSYFVCQKNNFPVRGDNQMDVLRDVFDRIEFGRMGCRFFMQNVFQFLPPDLRLQNLRQILQRRQTVAVNESFEMLTFVRFLTANIVGGKRYGTRPDYVTQRPRRKRRRNRPDRLFNPVSQEQRSQDETSQDQVNQGNSSSDEHTASRDPSLPRDEEVRGNLQPAPSHPVARTVHRITSGDNIADTLSFMCSHDALLHKVQVFGCDQGRNGYYRINLKILEEDQEVFEIVHNLLETNGQPVPYDLDIAPPVDISKDKVYTLYMIMEGNTSYQGSQGNIVVEKRSGNTNMEVVFITNEIGWNGTSNTCGQFPAIVLEKKRVV